MEENKNMSNVKKMRVAEYCYSATPGYHPVFSEDNEELYSVSDDRRDLCVDVRRALCGAPRRPLRKGPRKPEIFYERNEYIRSYIERNVPDFYDKVETLIFNTIGCHEDELFVFDAEFLRSIFPNLKTVCCHDTVTIENASPALRVLDPFEVGEYSFELARAKNFDEADHYFGMLWAWNSEWAKIWGEVANDYNRKPEDHPKPDYEAVIWSGMDDLFRLYLLGRYTRDYFFEEENKVTVNKHQDFNKAIAFLPTRFQNCGAHEVGEKLFWDLQDISSEKEPDYDSFVKVILESEKIIPGAFMGLLKGMCTYGCITKNEWEGLSHLLLEASAKGLRLETEVLHKFFGLVTERVGHDVFDPWLKEFEALS
ncbi:MAG: hypothetical protein IJX76_01015 [Clostridia bacterium]|nr:hypothetical protein [Clostridia bacterium]